MRTSFHRRMGRQDLERWVAISDAFDRAIDLRDAERGAFLAELQRRDASVADAVRQMLTERDELDRHALLSREAALPAQSPGLVGQRIGAYTLDRIIGHGGMGTVWLAQRSDGRYEGRAAIKFLNASLVGRPAEQRFVREGSVLAKLRHPCIAQLSDAGVGPTGQPYLILEYVDGVTIDRYADAHQLSVEARVRLFLDVVSAVAHAHSHLIVHRDIKPSNILVTPAGQVKLLDFGVAALLDGDAAELTRELEPGLTPGYAAPEQIRRETVTTATDVYALGVVLCLLLTGKHPFTQGAALHEHLQLSVEDAPLASALISEPERAKALRGDLDTIVAKAMKPRSVDRYQTAEALASDLRCYLQAQPIAARPDSLLYRAGKFVRRHRHGVMLGAAMLAVLASASIVATWQMIEARRQRDAALFQSQRAEFQSRFAYHIMSEVGGDDRPITIRELMAKGIEVLEANYQDDPNFVIGMLVNISGRYLDLGDTRGEYAALVKAEEFARKLGSPERIAYVQCNTVETELAMGQVENARARLDDGLANLAKVSNPSFDRISDCRTAQVRLYWAEGNLPQAIALATELAESMEREQRTADLLYTKLTSMIEVMLSLEGRRKEAREWNGRTVRALELAGDTTGLGMSAARHNLAGHLYEAGEIRAALEMQRQAIEPLAVQEGADNANPRLAHRYGLFKVRVEENDAGLEWIERAIAAANSNDDLGSRIGALLARARAHALLGRWSQVPDDVEAVEQLARTNPQEYRPFLRAATFVRAQMEFATGDKEQARARIEDLLNDVGYPQKRTADQLSQMLLFKSRIDLARGEAAAALRSAQQAFAAAAVNASEPDRSALVGAAWLAIARAQRALGNATAARATAQRAAVALSAGLGPDHSEVRDARDFE